MARAYVQSALILLTQFLAEALCLKESLSSDSAGIFRALSLIQEQPLLNADTRPFSISALAPPL